MTFLICRNWHGTTGLRDRGPGTGQCSVSSNIVFDTFEIGGLRTKSIKGYGWNDSLERRVWLHVVPFCSKKHFCVVYDATFCCFFYLVDAVFPLFMPYFEIKTLSLRCKIWYQYQKMYSNMIFERKKYLDELIAGRGNGLVKIITGVRTMWKVFPAVWHLA